MFAHALEDRLPIGEVRARIAVPLPGNGPSARLLADIVGAVGISGDIGDNDEACAITAIEAAGLTAVPGLMGGAE